MRSIMPYPLYFIRNSSFRTRFESEPALPNYAEKELNPAALPSIARPPNTPRNRNGTPPQYQSIAADIKSVQR